MPKFAEHRDLFKFNKELLDDDYNPGQALVVKAKVTHPTDKKLESSITAKVGNPKADDTSAVAIECKCKGDTGPMNQENSFNNKGLLHCDMKFDISKQTGCDGLKLQWIWDYMNSGNDVKSDFGWWYKQGNLACRGYYDFIRGGVVGWEGTWLYKDALLGDKGQIDLKNKQMLSYEAGVHWTPKDNINIGLNHVFNTANGSVGFGKVLLMFHNRVNAARTLGSEFVYDHAKKSSSARFGFTHQFAEGTDAKFRIDSSANLHVLLKHKVSSNLTAAFNAGINVQDFAFQQTKPHPVGVQLDWKF